MTTVAIFVCDDEAKAQDARGVLIHRGFPADGITVEHPASLTYDAAVYIADPPGPKTAELRLNKWVVTGRKP